MAGPRHTQRERAQMTVLAALLFVVLIGVAAVLVDGGRWLLENRNAQGVADAAAMAASRELSSGGSPEAMAQEYVDRNGDDEITLESVTVDGNEVRVAVFRDSPGYLSAVAGVDEAHITATAAARALQAGGIEGALPFAFMQDGFTVDLNEPIKVEQNLGPGNRGVVRLPMQGDCEVGSGGNDVRDAIEGEACVAPVGSTIETETGNTWGPIRSALDQRIGDNVQSFEEVFTWDASTSRYVVADIESPRLAAVPIVTNPDGSTEWPSGASPITVVAYALVYIGKRDTEGYPPYTNEDKSVWVTPVRALLPEELDAVFGDGFDPNSTSPIQFRLVD